MSISNNEIKRIKSLRMKKFRDQLNLFTVEGEKLVAEALDSDFIVEATYYKDDIGEEAMTKISQLTTPPPALAVVKKPQNLNLENSQLSKVLASKGLFLALDSIRDPGNLGTILRISDWFGIDRVFASPDTVDLFNSKTVQATMGAIFRVKFHYCDLGELCEQVKSKEGRIYGSFLEGNILYKEDLAIGDTNPVLIIIGNESRGISKELELKVTDKLYIPPYPIDNPGSESLNAAIATAIILAEFSSRFL